MAEQYRLSLQELYARVHALPDASDIPPPSEKETLAIMQILQQDKSPINDALKIQIERIREELDEHIEHFPLNIRIITENDLMSTVALSVIAGVGLAINSIGKAQLEHDAAFVSSMFDKPLIIED